ncbi:conserved hypothetical protein [Pediculus humanus corporis]|uniref:Pre-mRNA-splicing factor 38 n=1 Tax=Pediculus humanus subsp. corporis TaxID=121224 RepID=E0VHT3_PEDHC|nr:uncharacterized protein Phum_PHUM210830 [Pediculus humanus corporis]EEB12856.1 conserved hypothetical protein [Pediculus humanus corporis]
MNLNPLILTNIQSSYYFKVNLYELKTYREVIDEIFYKVNHLEPWEKGSRKTAGQTGMCGGVRGVGAGGIVSTAYCLLYKLFTLHLTRKQLNGLINHRDSPYIRALGFMYIRYTQPPADLYDWFENYLEDAEEMDVKAGGGQIMTIGDMLRHFLTKLEWFSTLFPRIPVPIQQKIERKINERFPPHAQNRQKNQGFDSNHEARHIPDDEVSFGEAEKYSRSGLMGRSNDRRGDRYNRGGGGGGGGQSYRDRSPGRNDRYRERERSSRYDDRRDRDRGRDRDRDRDKKYSRHGRDRDSRRDYADELAREKERQRNEKDRNYTSSR